MIISIYRSIYSCIELYLRIFWGIGKYRWYENRYRIVTNLLIYTPSNQIHFFNSCFHTAVSFCCVYFVFERKATPNTTQQLQVRSAGFEALKRCLLLNCIQEGWTTVSRYSATLVKPQYCRLLHWVIWYQTTTRQQKYLSTIFYCR